MRASEALGYDVEVARVIDRETNLPQLIEACTEALKLYKLSCDSECEMAPKPDQDAAFAEIERIEALIHTALANAGVRVYPSPGLPDRS